jgi:cyanophycin synthetase
MLYPPENHAEFYYCRYRNQWKTTTTRLLAHCKNNGFKVGFTTSDGIYIQNHMMEKGDTTGPLSAEYILKDPTVEFAVLETARGGTCDLVWVLVYVILELLLIFRRIIWV